MKSPDLTLLCDGCGRPASPEHLAVRLQRLEAATRYRPVHIGVLFLGLAAPRSEEEYLYSRAAGKETPAADFAGESLQILRAARLDVQTSAQSGTRERLLEEFQRRGCFLAHILECPLPPTAGAGKEIGAAASHLPAVLARIRRSLKPRQIVPVSSAMEGLLGRLADGGLAERLLLDGGGTPFALDGPEPAAAAERLRNALEGEQGPGR